MQNSREPQAPPGWLSTVPMPVIVRLAVLRPHTSWRTVLSKFPPKPPIGLELKFARIPQRQVLSGVDRAKANHSLMSNAATAWTGKRDEKNNNNGPTTFRDEMPHPTQPEAVRMPTKSLTQRE